MQEVSHPGFDSTPRTGKPMSSHSSTYDPEQGATDGPDSSDEDSESKFWMVSLFHKWF